MTTNDEIRIGYTGKYYEITLHDESLDGDTQVNFTTAETADEAMGVARELCEGGEI